MVHGATHDAVAGLAAGPDARPCTDSDPGLGLPGGDPGNGNVREGASILRPEKSRGGLDRIEALLRQEQDQVPPKGPTGKAIRYAPGQWAGLTRFVEDGAIPIDNNATKRALRPVAIGRSNWRLCGSEAGGKWAATQYGLFGSCRLQDKNPPYVPM